MFKQMLHQRAGGGTDCLGPVQKPPRRPLQMVLVGFGHMRGQRGMTALVGAAAMGGDAGAFAEDFDGRGGEAHVHRLTDEAMGHTIEMALRFEMIIEMDASMTPFGLLVGGGGQRLERRLIRGEELGMPRAGQFLEGAVIEVSEQCGQGGVEFRQTEETLMTEPR